MHAVAAWLWVLTRPVLYLRLLLFRRLVADNLYLPVLRPMRTIGTADRAALIGSAEACRVGVLSDELSTLGQIARRVSTARGRPFVWSNPAPGVRTIRRALRSRITDAGTPDVVVVVLGFSDALLMTPPSRWGRDLERLHARIQKHFGTSCGVVFAGLAPMDEFRYTARLGRRRIRRQVHRLNQATSEAAQRLHHCRYVGPPTFPHPLGHPGDEQYSWASIHAAWGSALAPVVIDYLTAFRPDSRT